jgi:hypothetical protein
LFAQESRQRSAPRRPGPAGYPRCGRPAGPVAKLATLRQRDRTSPGEPSSLGGTEGDANRRACDPATKTNPKLTHLVRRLITFAGRNWPMLKSNLRKQKRPSVRVAFVFYRNARIFSTAFTQYFHSISTTCPLTIRWCAWYLGPSTGASSGATQ